MYRVPNGIKLISIVAVLVVILEDNIFIRPLRRWNRDYTIKIESLIQLSISD